MSDLCAPIYVVMGGDEEMTFWCFVSVMERMVRQQHQKIIATDRVA
jgi:TBC1 domain family member 15